MTSVRLPTEIVQKLDALAKRKHTSKSALIKEALEAYLEQETQGKTAYELGEPYFGRFGSGDGSLSVNYKDRLKDKIRARKNPG
jgi:Arc/MetJ-type ribon-helix-helix transcriptional regulator